MPKFFTVEITTKTVYLVATDKAEPNAADLAEKIAADGRAQILDSTREFTHTEEVAANISVIDAIRRIVTPDNIKLGVQYIQQQLTRELALDLTKSKPGN